MSLKKQLNEKLIEALHGVTELKKALVALSPHSVGDEVEFTTEFGETIKGVVKQVKLDVGVGGFPITYKPEFLFVVILRKKNGELGERTVTHSIEVEA